MAYLEAKNSIIFAKKNCNIFEVAENWKFQIFLTLWKNNVKIELRKSQKKLVPTQTFEFKFGMQGLIQKDLLDSQICGYWDP